MPAPIALPGAPALFGFITPEALVALLGIGAVLFASLLLVLKNVLYVCQPNEVLVFSGRSRRRPDGRIAGYRIIRGGRGVRVPLFETVDRMDLTNMVIEVTVRNAYSRGGIPLSVQGVANIKVPGEEPLLNNCLERFLGKPRADIAKTARETLEGNLRGVLATLTPEQVNKDKESFAAQLATEAEQDLNKLGLVLDTLKIQNVTDEVGYLDAIGRQRSAQIRCDAQIAEARAQAEAAVNKWRNTMEAELAKLDAEIEIARKENDRRIADARTGRAAKIAKERAEVQAEVSEAQAGLETQRARIEQVRLQLRADVLQPAEAERARAEAAAQGDAATVIEQGRATAKVLQDLAASYGSSGGAARDVMLLQKLVPLLDTLSGTIGDLRVDRLTVLGRGSASTGGGRPLASQLVEVSEQIKAATGIDVPQALRERLASPATPNA
jgi:flotillin